MNRRKYNKLLFQAPLKPRPSIEMYRSLIYQCTTAQWYFYKKLSAALAKKFQTNLPIKFSAQKNLHLAGFLNSLKQPNQILFEQTQFSAGQEYADI